MKKYTFYLSGTHCASCKIFIEDTLGAQDFVHSAKVDLEREILEIETSDTQSPIDIAQLITTKIQSNGYSVSVERVVRVRQGDDVFWKALLIGMGFLFLFFVLQKSGILNIGIGAQINPLTSFIVGLIASVSSCLAVVGGLVLSLSAKLSQDDIKDTNTFILFHVGRLVSFALFGGLLGALGGLIGISFTFSAVLGILASVVMVLLGLNLIGVFEKNKIVLPAGLFNFLRRVEHKIITPVLVGVSTFFLPCGFTQSMQFSALSSGSFVSGLLIMSSFALGTLPVLLFISFGSASLGSSKYAPLFFKSAGVVVIGLGVFAILAGLAGLGIINPLFNI